MDARLDIEDGEVLGTLQRLIALGRNPEPALREVASLGEASTRMRFRLEVGPDGQRWKASIRSLAMGGKTLTKDGHLSGSVTSNAGKDFAEWGVNRIYAAIHQFGGIIRAKTAAALKFMIPGAGFRVVKAVRMPARPYLGVNDDDRSDILDVFERHIGSASGGAAHVG